MKTPSSPLSLYKPPAVSESSKPWTRLTCKGECRRRLKKEVKWMRVRRCRKCNGQMVRTDTEWICTGCGRRLKRFITPNNKSPLFLTLVPKNTETKKFIEELQKPKPRIQKYEKNGLLFFRNEQGEIVDVMPLYKYAQKLEKVCERLAEEIRNRK